MPEKNNQRDFKNLRIVIEIIGVALAIGIAWATLRGSVNNNMTVIEKHEARIRQCESTDMEVKSDIREIKVEQKYISKGIEEIKEKLK